MTPASGILAFLLYNIQIGGIGGTASGPFCAVCVDDHQVIAGKVVTLFEGLEVLKHAGQVAFFRVDEGRVDAVVLVFVACAKELVFNEEGIELVLCGLHANQDLVPAGVINADVDAITTACLKKAVEDATESIDLVDRLHLTDLFLVLSLPCNRAAEVSDLCTSDRATSATLHRPLEGLGQTSARIQPSRCVH